MTSIQVKSRDGYWMSVEAECLPNEEYLIIEKDENEKLGEFHDGDIVKCEEESGKLYAFEKINKNS